jgi:uncharacterized cupin superfamily protein
MSGDKAPEKPIKEPFRVEDVPWEEWSEGTRFGSRVRHISHFGGATQVGVLLEELAPGKQSSPAHYHLREEEHIWIVEGASTLRLGDKTYEVKAGDFMTFPAGQKAGHCLVNNSNALCRFIVIGNRNPNDVCVYTDSRKVKLSATGQIFDTESSLKYWDREDTGQ